MVEKKHNSYWMQAQNRDKNRRDILNLLYQRRRTFNELLKITGFSPMGLTKMLKDLVKGDKIEKVDPKQKRSPYKIKGKALDLRELSFIGDRITNLMNKGGKHYVDLLSGHDEYDFALAYGIQSYMVIDPKLERKKKPLFDKKDRFDIALFIYEKLLKKWKEMKMPFDEDLDAEIILAFKIDYKYVLETIREQSKEQHKTWVKEKYKELEKST